MGHILPSAPLRALTFAVGLIVSPDSSGWVTASPDVSGFSCEPFSVPPMAGLFGALPLRLRLAGESRLFVGVSPISVSHRDKPGCCAIAQDLVVRAFDSPAGHAPLGGAEH
jgi:hypothetical protein